MARKKRKVPQTNSSSTADMAFILLIFFLITTSMDTDRGLARLLPPPPQNEQKQDDIIIKERNVLQVRLNSQNQLLCGSDYISVTQLREKAKEFISNPTDATDMPEKHLKNIPLLGNCMITSNHVISVQTDRGTSYDSYFYVQNELVGAYNELRNELAKSKFGKPYDSCSKEQQTAVRAYYPMKISEAEPKNYGGKK